MRRFCRLGQAFIPNLGDKDSAAKFYQQAAAIDPENSEVDAALGSDCAGRGETTQAAHYFRRIASRHPECLLKRLRAETPCDLIPQDNAYIDDYRRRLSETLSRLSSEPLQLHLDQLHSSGAEPPMAIAYQGRDDRPLKATVCGRSVSLEDRAASGIATSPIGKAASCRVVVTNGHEGVYAECLGRLVARLATRSEMDVTVICSRAGANVIPYLLGESAVRYLPLADTIEAESVRRLVDAEIRSTALLGSGNGFDEATYYHFSAPLRCNRPVGAGPSQRVTPLFNTSCQVAGSNPRTSRIITRSRLFLLRPCQPGTPVRPSPTRFAAGQHLAGRKTAECTFARKICANITPISIPFLPRFFCEILKGKSTSSKTRNPTSAAVFMRDLHNDFLMSHQD